MPADDIVRLDLVATAWGQNIINSFHFKYLTGAASDAGLIAAWQAGMQTTWLTWFPPQYTLVGYSAMQVWPGPLDSQRGPAEVNVNLTGGRTVTGDENPTWFAEDIRVFTAGRGRSRHGRWFPWVALELDQSLDTLVGNYVTVRNTVVAGITSHWLPGGSDITYRYGVYSRRHAYIPGTHPPAFNPSATVTDVFRDATLLAPAGVLTTQRSRRP